MRQIFILAVLSAGLAFQPFILAGAGSEISSKSKSRTASTTTSLSSTSSSMRTFTPDQGIQTAFLQNPAILSAIQKIERTKGMIIEIRAQAWHIYSETA